MTKWVTVLDIRLGAIYQMATKLGWDETAVAKLLNTRAGMPAKAAEQLAAHWFTTEPLRNGRVA